MKLRCINTTRISTEGKMMPERNQVASIETSLSHTHSSTSLQVPTNIL